MSNSLSALNPYIWKPMVQDYLNNSLISMAVCNTKVEALLTSGSRVNFPYTADVRVQDYAQGTDLTIDSLEAIQDYIDIDQSKVVTFPMDPVQEKQALANYGADLAYQAAYQLKNNIDQKNLDVGASAASATVAGGSISSSTIISKMTDVYAQLQRNNATDGEMFAILDPERTALLSQTFIANGFQIADNSLRNGFSGRALGFDVYTSNNLKYSVDLSMATKPTATDTVVIAGVTFTFVASIGTAAGNVLIGADVAASQAALRTLINDPTTTTATGVALSTEDARVLQNAQVTSGAWGSDVSTITGYGKLSCSETFTDATDGFGTETSNMLFGKKGAISLAIQMQPELYITQEPKQLTRNYLTHALFGSKVFHRDAKRLVNLSVNA